MCVVFLCSVVFLNLKYVFGVCVYMVAVAVTVLLCARLNKPLNQTAGV